MIFARSMHGHSGPAGSSRLARQVVTAAALLVTGIAVVDMATPSWAVLIGAYALGPCLVAASASPTATAAMGIYALALGTALSWRDHIWGSLQQAVVLATIAAATMIGVTVARRIRAVQEAADLRRAERDVLAGVLESSDDAIVVGAFDGTIRTWNAGAERMYGYRREEMIGRNVALIMPPKDASELPTLMTQVSQGDHIERYESQRFAKDGTVLDVWVNLAPVRDRHGTIVAASAIAQDITGRKQTERALVQLAAIVDSSVDAIIGADLNGTITSWNNGAERMFGHAAAQVVGRSIRVLAPPGDDAQDEMLVRAARGEEITPYEATRVRQDGTTIEVALSKSPVRDVDGKVTGIALIARDITDSKRTAEALRAVIESASDPFVSIDDSDRVVEWNRRAEELFGWSREEILGRRLADFVVPARAREAHSAGIADAMTGGGAGILDRTRDIVAVRRDGSEFPAEIAVWQVPTRTGNQFSAFVRDVSQRQQFERELAETRDRALEASRLKSEFLAMMSHEIRTPMNGVIGLTGLLLRGELSESARRHAERIRTAGQALLAVINDILDFSKIEAGALTLDDSPVSLSATVEEVLDLVAESARGKGLELIGQCDPDLPDLVRGDPVRIRQILLNFAVNAVKFTQQGEVYLHVTSTKAELPETTDQSVVHVLMEVADTGIGIGSDQVDRLFDAFAQADSSTTRRFGGTGLGLAICRELAEAMGGQVGVRSEVGAGSVFWCRLPLVANQTARSDGATMKTLKGLRLLIVDQNETSRRVLSEQARAWAILPSTAATEAEAIDILWDASTRRKPIDIMITDVQLPGSGGVQLARLVRDDPGIRPLPIVLMSSDESDLTAELHAEGVTATISKPVQQSQLYDCLIQLTQKTARATASESAVGHRTAAAGGARVLLAEDNETNQIVACGVLEELGYQVDVANDGMEALELLRVNRYDAVLLDCQMPGMDGYEATAEIRRREATAQSGTGDRIPVIAMTAAAFKGDRERCFAAGMDDYLAKPFEPDDLDAVLRRWITDSRSAPTAGQAATPAPADEIAQRLEKLRAHVPPATITRLLTAFADDSRRCLDQLDSALRDTDTDALRRAAHTLKGAAASVGAGALSRSCELLEGLAERGRVEDAAQVASRLHAEHAHAQATLDTIDAQHTEPVDATPPTPADSGRRAVQGHA